MKRIFKVVCGLLLLTIFFSLSGCSSFWGNKATYVYQGENGLYATLTVDFDNGTYTYEGNGFYSSSAGYMLRPNTSYKVSSTIYFQKEVNNEKYYIFHDHPWNNNYYFVLSEDGQIISGGIRGIYKFYKQ